MLAALDRVRRDLAELGADEASAADVPAGVTARVSAALQAARSAGVPSPPGIVRRHAAGPAQPSRLLLRHAGCGAGTSRVCRRRRRGRPRRGDADP